MAELSNHIINLRGLKYFNENVVSPTYDNISMLADALSLIQSWMTDTETRVTTLENNSGGSVALASMFEIGLADTYHVETEADAPTIIANSLNLDGFAVPIGTSGVRWGKPIVETPTITWSNTVDDNYDLTGTANVRIWFGEAGNISKTVTFKKPGEGKLYAVKLEDSSAIIDTGIAGDYSYRFHVKGHTQQGMGSVLASAFLSTSARTEMRMLGNSNKVQVMFPLNKEITSTAAGVDFNKTFEATYGANFFSVSQGGSTYNASISGHTDSGAVGATITLLNSRAGGYGNSVSCFTEILNGNTVVGYFAPYQLHAGEVVLLRTDGLTAPQIYDIVENGDNSSYATGRILRPDKGALISVTQSEDEAA